MHDAKLTNQLKVNQFISRNYCKMTIAELADQLKEDYNTDLSEDEITQIAWRMRRRIVIRSRYRNYQTVRV
jgi:hypothetical protein